MPIGLGGHDPNAGGGKPPFGASTVHFCVQFLDVAAAVIREMHSDWRSVAGAIEPVAGLGCPTGAVRMVVLDAVGVEAHSQWR
jgi:hypothetical protein